MRNNIPSYLLEINNSYPNKFEKKSGLSLIEKSIKSISNSIKSIYLQADFAVKKSFIYTIHPHIKVLSLLYLAVIISISNNIIGLLILTVFIIILYFISKLNILHVYKKIFFISFIFGFLIILPASLNIITKGEIWFTIVTLDSPYHFWIYHIPKEIGVTKEGCNVVIRFFLRVFNSVSFAFLIIYTTPFPKLIKSFKIIGIPDTFLLILSLTFTYIIILAKTIEDAYFALKSRMMRNIKNKKIRMFIADRIYFIFKKSRSNYENTYLAMVSKGYTGKIKLFSFQKIKKSDIISLFIIILLGLYTVLI